MLNVIDIVFILIVVVFVLRCYLKGFTSSILSMAAIVLGLLVALFFYKNGGDYLRARFWPGLELIPEIVAFVALFLIGFIANKLLDAMLKGVIQGIKLEGVDKFLGIIFGLVEGLVIVGLILLILRLQPLFDSSSLLSNSIFARILLPLITRTGYISGV